MIGPLSAEELQAWLNDPARPAPLLLDVREPWEYELCHLPDSQLLPLDTLPADWERLDPARDVVCICHHGIRSRSAAAFLVQQGLTRVYNLTGGVDAWARRIDPLMPVY